MFLRVTKTQTALLLRQKEAVITFYILLALVSMTFIGNVLSFHGSDVLSMYQPMKLLSLSYNRTNWNADITLLVIQLYPLLVVCPAGFSLVKEYHTKESLFMVGRLGSTTYYFSKLLAAFISTFIIFCVPFLLEIVLNCISFPLAATGDLTNQDIYDPQYIAGVRNYLFHGLFLCSPYLYAIFAVLFFGFVSGLLGVFTVAFSALVRVKYRVFLFLPVFILMNGTLYAPMLLGKHELQTEWYHYLLLFNDEQKHAAAFCLAILLLAAFSVAATWFSSRRDHL